MRKLPFIAMSTLRAVVSRSPLISIRLVALSALAIVPLPALATGYNHQAAANYAVQYWNNYNSNYKSFGNDCTNFASEALRAGGWSNTGWFYSSDWNWFCNGGGWGYHSETWSWNNADDLCQFLWRSGRAELQNYWDLEPGDIVQVNWGDGTGSGAQHTMIVTDKAWDGTLYLTQHSNNRLNKSLWDYVREKPNAGWYFWHIKDNF